MVNRQVTPAFSFPYVCFLLQISTKVSVFFLLFCKTADIYMFLWNSARDIGARPARIDPVAHARLLNALELRPQMDQNESINLRFNPERLLAQFFNYEDR